MGISAGLAALISTLGSGAAAVGTGLGEIGTLAASGLGGLGVGAETAGIIGSGLSSAIGGAGIGAGEAALTGGDIGAGALGGGLSFGLGDIGGAVAPALGLGGSLGGNVGSALGGALGGTAAAGIEGNSLAAGAASGALGGLGEHALGSPSTWGAPAPAGAGAAATAPSASGLSLPGGGAPADLTATGGAGAGGGAGGALTTPGTQLTANVPGIGSSAGGASLSAPSFPGGVAANIVPTGGLSANLGAGGSSPGIGTEVANSLGLGPQTGAFLDNHGGQILQGGLEGAVGLQQRSQENKLLGPLKEQAAGFANQGQALSGALFGGQLPQGAQDAVSLATQSAKARTKSTYAQLGLSGSTMESDALGEIDRQASAQTFQFANELLQSGMKDSQMSSELYNGILQTQLSQDKALQEAIANFSAQLMGGQAQPGGKAI